jgi:TetR/AcrR family acrAB operon transcriptional repressor
MVRKTKEAALATREALVDAAERVFRRNGVTRTSLADVAAEAGMTRGAIYWHFRDKAELLEAMCSRTTMPHHAGQGCLGGGGAATDPLGALRAYAIDTLVQLAHDPHTHAVMEILFHKCELTGDLAERGVEQARQRNQCMATVEGLVRHAIEERQLPAGTDPVLATRFLHAGVVGLMHEWVAAPHEYDLADAAPALVDALIAGVHAAPLRAPASAAPAASGAAPAAVPGND